MDNPGSESVWITPHGWPPSGAGKDVRSTCGIPRLPESAKPATPFSRLADGRAVELVSLRESIDTTTATGRCFLSMMGAIHQMERELRAERAAAGRASAKARGKTGGRPRTDATKLENARILYENSGKTAAEVCVVAGVGRRTFFSYLAKRKQAHASGSEGGL
jgi:DNA invertase Pin-like site-specific DNA recombinase